MEKNAHYSLTLRYTPQHDIPLAESKDKVMRHLHRLWKFDVRLEQEHKCGKTDVISQCSLTKSEP
ncbi:hypothetical protein [Alteromonas sp. BMJM2]|uniref:hypothetical protein n=1 Tax=Alteromonas sp. BMJM2 TaxID=2954241 RepID=UPI003FA40703